MLQQDPFFFGLPGSRTDGASFVADAAQAGAIAAVVSTDSEIDNAGLPVIRSDNPRAALAHAAALFFDNQPETMAAVTGTAGKTSVATFLRRDMGNGWQGRSQSRDHPVLWHPAAMITAT